jgi:hypothetical protein
VGIYSWRSSVVGGRWWFENDSCEWLNQGLHGALGNDSPSRWSTRIEDSLVVWALKLSMLALQAVQFSIAVGIEAPVHVQQT